jgi:G:T-mismatch repair DNA endonuclease (very short patch repair protein)
MESDPHNLCFARAVYVAMIVLLNDPQRDLIRRHTRGQLGPAYALMRRAGVAYGTLCGHAEWERFQRLLGENCSLVVVCREYGNSIVFYGNPSTGVHRLCVYLAQGHYHVITRLPAFLGTVYVCPHCLRSSESRGEHNCSLTCSWCKHRGVCGGDGQEHVFCSRCNITFPSTTCHARHLSSGLCQQRTRCRVCGQVVQKRRRNDHKCGYRICTRCRVSKPAEHDCFMMPSKELEGETGGKPKRYVIYDFESMVGDDGSHGPNLCVVHKVCSLCMSLPMDANDGCSCGRTRIVFKGPRTVEEFGDFLCDGYHTGYTCIAHNASSYDGHFMLGYAHQRGLKLETVLNGQKILKMTIQGVHFIDSLCFFPMALSRLPAAFGLPDLCKGTFPHLFNLPENQTYVGTYPDADYYSPDDMSEEGRASFFEWYEQARGGVFDFQKEILKYCISDVDILQQACGAFRSLFVLHTGLEPFVKSFTLAGACNRVYRASYLREGEIALVPSAGYFKGRQSAIAVCWLETLVRTEGLTIQHYANGGERRVRGRFVDGLGADGCVFQFFGCWWHSCPECYKDRDAKHPLKGVRHRDNYDSTMAFVEDLRSAGHEVRVIWECAYRAGMGSEERELLKKSMKYEPLRPRDGFYGGRCEAIRLHAVPEEGVEIKYYDFTSLYPFICKYGTYPLGHPKVFTGAAIPARVTGLLKCKVLPPRDLYMPLLPYRARGKLLFALCRTCAEEGVQEVGCEHDDEQRAFIGTWVTLELDRACELGYEIVERYEAWHYEETAKYDRETRTNGLWSDFMDVWIKLKQEASGYPDTCTTPEAEAQYVEDYLQQEGIQLDPARIHHNPGLRSLAKLMVSSVLFLLLFFYPSTEFSFVNSVVSVVGGKMKRLQAPRNNTFLCSITG